MSLEDSIRRDMPDPQAFSYANYAAYVVGANDAMRLKLKQFFEEIDFENIIRKRIGRAGGDARALQYSLFNIGSDGRNEKGPTSPHDILLLTKSDKLKAQGALQTSLDKTMSSLFVRANNLVLDRNGKRYATGAHRIFSDFEAKSLDADHMYAYKQQPDASWPSRIIDADIIMPNGKHLLTEAKSKLIREAITEGPGAIGTKMRSREKDKLKKHAKILTTGRNSMRGEEVEHFNIEEGVAHYNLSDEIHGVTQTSFKQGPLRLVQTAVVLKLLDTFRDPENSPEYSEELLSEMETQTTRKLSYLHAMGITEVSTEVMADLIDNYMYFLWLFHQSEYQYYANRNSAVPFDRAEVSERLEDVINGVSEFLNEGRTAKKERIVLG